MGAFEDSENKAAIRRLWDREVLVRWQSRFDNLLTYFGLPGAALMDLLDWREVLDPRRTGVQSMGRTKGQRDDAWDIISRMQARAHVFGLASGFQVLRGDIEDVILNAVDLDGNPPQMNDGQAASTMRFKYDLVNLDFCGGIGYREAAGVKRVDAIKKLFERQQAHNFVLLLTINVRDTLGDEIAHYLQQLRAHFNDNEWRDTVDWYLARGNGEREYRLKAVVPTFIRMTAEARNFRCTCLPPIIYIGHNQAHMLHFAFELETEQVNGRIASLRGFSNQNDRDLLALPLLRCETGQLAVAAQQHPGFLPSVMDSLLDFLPDGARAAILAPTLDPLMTRGRP